MESIISRIKKRKKSFVIGILLIFLILTNPTVRDFNDFLGKHKHTNYFSSNPGEILRAYNVKRKLNLFILSIYENEYGTIYLGIAKNFIHL